MARSIVTLGSAQTGTHLLVNRGANVKPYGFANPFSTSLRIASDRDGRGSGCFSIHASIRAASSGRKDELNCRPFPMGGRPRFFSRTFS
jgi:hypothetical protein